MDELSSQPPHIATQQEKLDAVFGITQGQDLDNYLDSLSLDLEEVKAKDDALSSIGELSAVDQSIKEKLVELQSMPTAIVGVAPNDLSVQIASTSHALKQLEDMLELSKDIIKHVHSSILATPLIDSEAVQAYSKLIESYHISMTEFIGVYRDKQNFANKVKYALFDYQQKKDLLRYKADLQIEIMKAKDGPKSIDAESIETNSRAWNVDQVTKIIDNQNQQE